MKTKTAFQEIYLTTQDNVQISANHYKNGFDSVVVLAPGWCMTKDSAAFMELADRFSEKHDVLTFDFRGHGKSKGQYTFTAKETQEVEAAVEYVKDYEKVYLVGFSLGAASSFICASQNDKIDKLILVSPPCDFDKIENQMWRKEAWGETFKKFELGRFLSIRPCVFPLKKVKPIDVVESVKIPVLFIAGEKDPTVHCWHTKKLFESACCAKDLKIFPEGIHAEDLFLHYPDEFMDACNRWLDF